MGILYVPPTPHRCEPPGAEVTNPFGNPFRYVKYPVGTVYQCDECRDVSVVEADDQKFYGRKWVRKTEAQADPILRAIRENS